MALLSSIGTAKNALSGLASDLGLTGWQLSTGKYNGCSFAHFTGIPLLENNALYKQGESLISSVNQITGSTLLASKDPNGFGNLSDTVLGLVKMTSEYIPQIAIKPTPYGIKANTEDVGSAGYEFKFTIVAIGADYQKAISNIERLIKSPPIDSNNLVLEHPTRGIINGITRCTYFKVIEEYSQWNGATLEITFRSEESNISKEVKGSYVKSVTQAILSGLGTITATNSALSELTTRISTATGLLGFGNRYSVAPKTFTQIKQLSSKTTGLNNRNLQSMNYIYKNSNTGASNITLNNTSSDPKYLPSSLAFPSQYNSLQGSLLLDEYYKYAKELIETVKGFGYNGESNNYINSINQSIATLYNLANLAAQTATSYTYSVPYTMSIHEVLARNGRGFDQASIVLRNNPQIPSANFIVAGTRVLL